MGYIVEREVVGIAASKIEVFAVEQELGAGRCHKALGSVLWLRRGPASGEQGKGEELREVEKHDGILPAGCLTAGGLDR